LNSSKISEGDPRGTIFPSNNYTILKHILGHQKKPKESVGQIDYIIEKKNSQHPKKAQKGHRTGAWGETRGEKRTKKGKNTGTQTQDKNATTATRDPGTKTYGAAKYSMGSCQGQLQVGRNHYSIRGPEKEN